MSRQTLISVEIKRKQYMKALGVLAIPIVGLILRILIQLLPALSFIAKSVGMDDFVSLLGEYGVALLLRGRHGSDTRHLLPRPHDGRH